MSRSIFINQREIGPGAPAYVIAELSANHNQDLGQALDIVRAAHRAGADAIKIQTYTPDSLTIRSDREEFRVKGGTAWDGETLYDLYSRAQMPWEWFDDLRVLTDSLGMDLFSTPFDEEGVAFLRERDVPAFKVASFEIVDLPLIRQIAAAGKPTIMSTGMATLAEITEAVETFREAGGTELALLKCTSAYPAPASDMNLLTIPHLRDAFGLPVGLSDHTLGIAAPVAAVAVGASIIEKHLTLSRAVPGPDSGFSLEPEEFAAMTREVAAAQDALGSVFYGTGDNEKASSVFRRSLFVVKDIAEGERFTSDNVRSIRPGFGLHTRYLDVVLERRASRDIACGTPLSWDLLAV